MSRTGLHTRPLSVNDAHDLYDWLSIHPSKSWIMQYPTRLLARNYIASMYWRATGIPWYVESHDGNLLMYVKLTWG